MTALQKAGFVLARVSGSHHILRHPDGRGATVPVHSGETLGPALVRKILTTAELTAEQLAELL